MTDVDALLYGTDLFGDPASPTPSGPIAERFLIPPFSVLNAAEGFWQERKRAWLSLGIESEVGRGEDLAYNTGAPSETQSSWDDDGEDEVEGSGTSVFDPVLCELVYRWFAPDGGRVLDPFAGGSVRGVVAHALGLEYVGIELRAEQVQANRDQAREIVPDRRPTWFAADSRAYLQKHGDTMHKADLVFTCPPYGDLEVYSDDPADLSNMTYEAFLEGLSDIMAGAAACLRPDRFVCMVVGDFRDTSTGLYRGFPADVVRIMRDLGLGLYNHAVLVTPRGSLPIRITRQFKGGRKLGKTHQDVLVFAKGDGKKAGKACAVDPGEANGTDPANR